MRIRAENNDDFVPSFVDIMRTWSRNNNGGPILYTWIHIVQKSCTWGLSHPIGA